MTIKELHEIFLKCGSVSTDSRKISQGQLFIALKGENFDGNVYAIKALEDGAAYAVVNKDSEAALLGDERIIAVDDTLTALWELARYHRETLSIPVVGLTGTNGKTTTKELIKAVLSAKYKVSATSGNLNNNIGVPLTVLGIGDDAEIAIVEMGASHPGDIEELVRIAEPDYGLITNVGKAHLLGFGSFEGVMKTKGELYDFIASKGKKKIFLNADNEHLVEMAAQRTGLETVPYRKAEILPTSAFLRMNVGGIEINTHLVGNYNADNVLAAICVGEFFGVSLEDAAKAIEGYIPSNKRSQMQKTSRNTLIIDAYNANPTSMAASLDNFAAITASDKVALLGDMRELGEESENEHAKIVKKVQGMLSEGTLSRVYYVGEEFSKVTQNCFSSSENLRKHLEINPLENCTILIKGSRGIQMENVIPAL